MPEIATTTNGRLALASVALALAGLMFVVFRLQTDLLVQRIDSLEAQIVGANIGSRERRESVGKELSDHEAIDGHPTAMNEITSIEQKLLEVETQFRHTDRLIQLLWQRTYNEPLPNPINGN